MNVMISSTYGWNPGDEWIMYGCQNILRESVPPGTKLNWLLYNRNPDNMAGRRMYSQLEQTVGNYYTSDIPTDLIDLFIQAGSPEYHGPPAKNLHEAILSTDTPYILMGVGSTNGHVPLSDLDLKVFARPNTHIFTRSIEAANSINGQLGIDKAQALPCPAILATLALGVKSREEVQVPQTDHGGQRVKAKYLVGLDKRFPVVAERCEEFEHYSRTGFDVEYSNQAGQILAMIGRYRRVVTTRLHAAVIALGMGSEVIIVGEGDHRIETAAKMFDIPVVADFGRARYIDGKLDESSLIKWDTLEQYKDILQEILT